MKILGTGLNGLVGSRIVELLGSEFEFNNISRQTGVDISILDQVEKAITSSSAPIVLHLAAKTDVDGCEKDKDLGENGEAWKINVEGTKNIVEACKKTNKKLVYISTDFVFNGINPPREGYSETDQPYPIDWYGQTKYEGEKIVMDSNLEWLIMRIAYPYRASFSKNDFFRAIFSRLQNNLAISAITDAIFTPAFVDDIAKAFHTLVSENQNGIFHVAGSQSLSPYNSALEIAKIFNFDEKNIKKTTQEEFFKNRAKRPFHGIIKNAKIQKLGVSMSTFGEGILQIKAQINGVNV